MALEDDELYQAAQLSQNYNARLNSLFSATNFDFLNRQGKDLLDGTDATDATTLQQVQALVAAAIAPLQASLKMITTSGNIPPGYTIQVPASFNITENGGVGITSTVLNYSGAGVFVSFLLNMTNWSSAQSITLSYNIDSGPTINIKMCDGGITGTPKSLSTNAQAYTQITNYTSGIFPFFFYTTFQSSLVVKITINTATTAGGSGICYVGYATKN